MGASWQDLQNVQVNKLQMRPQVQPSVMDQYQYQQPVPPQGPGPQPYVNTEEPLGPPSIGPVSLDPTDYIGPGTLAKAAAGIKALLAGKGALGALGGAGKALAVGSLYRGGEAGLVPFHKTHPGALSKVLEDDVPLFAPSYAITEGNNLGSKFGNTTLVLRGEAVDPANTPGVLFNRDAYTRRIPFDVSKRSPEAIEAMRVNAALLRKQGMQGRFEEGSEVSGGPSHALAVDQSPNFRSFADYESSPRGAGVLSDYPALRARTHYDEKRAYNRFAAMVEPVVEYGDEQLSTLQMLKAIKAVSKGNWETAGEYGLQVPKSSFARDDLMDDARKLVQSARMSPSEYAEGKVLGELPLSTKTIKGVLLPVKGRDVAYGPELAQVHKLTELLRSRNIPIINREIFKQDFPNAVSGGADAQILRRVSDAY